ncbi:MAG TPA: hypothetical protein DCQ24_01865 [Bacteroidales bacterium]|nr:hypothetical protein [Bacteroidales bacterium]
MTRDLVKKFSMLIQEMESIKEKLKRVAISNNFFDLPQELYERQQKEIIEYLQNKLNALEEEFSNL